jgi:seryl-tRNA synthetase
MFAFTNQNESEQTHLELKEIEKEIFSELGLYFRVVDIPTGDLGSPAYRKYDIEAWMPSRGDFGEVTSTSNCTDYQSRRLNIKYRDENNDLQFVHTLNGTAIAVSRAILGIIENFQLEDGTIIIPEVLRPYMGGRDKIVKK